jgi:hypothetical protein
MSLELVTRTQYTFEASQYKLSKLLTLNVKAENNPHEVNIVGLSVVCGHHKNKKYKIHIVVGTDDPNTSSRGGAGDPANPDPQRTNDLQNAQFRTNMRLLKISFRSSTIIQILHVEGNTGTPGIYRVYFSALTCAKIPVNAFFQGEPALVAGLIVCNCADSTIGFESEVVSDFILVPSKYLQRAIQVLNNLTFQESQLCINANNVVDLLKKKKRRHDRR